MNALLRLGSPLLSVVTFALPAASVEPSAPRGDTAAATRTPTTAPEPDVFLGRVEVAYQNEHVCGVPMQMGDLGVSVGVAAHPIHAVVYLGLHQSLGKSEFGLTVWETSARPLIDFPFGRLHLALEPKFSLLGVQRTSEDGTMHALSFGGALMLGVDVIRTGEQSTLQLALRGGADLVGAGNAANQSVLPITHWYALSVAYGF